MGALEKTVDKDIIPDCVLVCEVAGRFLSSVKVTPRGDRQFSYVKGEEKICYVEKCLVLRGSYVTSKKLDQFSCKHLSLSNIECTD